MILTFNTTTRKISISFSLCLLKSLSDSLGSQGQYQGQWPPSLLPGQGQYRGNPPVVNNAASVSSQAMNNSLGPSPTSTPPRRSPVNPGEYKGIVSWFGTCASCDVAHPILLLINQSNN